MSTLLSAYLHGILNDFGCTEVLFVQDNCPGPVLTVPVEDSPSCGSSSIPELSRWDSSSNHNSADAVKMMSPEQKRTVRSLRPPRRQISFDSDDDEDDDGFHADYRTSKAAGSSISGRRRQGGENPLHLPVASAAGATASPRSVIDSRSPPPPPTNTTLPPRPPPRRTSSRLRTFVLRALDTNMDRYPPTCETDNNTVVTWPPPNTKLSTRSLLCDSNDDDTTTGYTNKAAVTVATNSNISNDQDMLSSKLMPMTVLDNNRIPSNNLEQAILDLKKKTKQKQKKKNHSPPSSIMVMNDDEVEEEDIAPPRKPMRQTTDELLNLAKGKEGTIHGGDSLRSLTLSLRRSKAGAVY